MGTNFYIEDYEGYEDDMNPDIHIGKRSAAGLYCWDCGVTLCKDGEQGIHSGYSEWYKKCPKCGKGPEEESICFSSVGRELGFNKLPFKRKTRVASCSSFTWSMSEEDFKRKTKNKKIVDEYGRKFSIKKFMEILKECPVRYYKIGERFS